MAVSTALEHIYPVLIHLPISLRIDVVCSLSSQKPGERGKLFVVCYLAPLLATSKKPPKPTRSLIDLSCSIVMASKVNVYGLENVPKVTLVL